MGNLIQSLKNELWESDNGYKGGFLTVKLRNKTKDSLSIIKIIHLNTK